MKCEVFCCLNKRKKTRGKSFFKFPREQLTADLWLKEIGREGAQVNDNRFVCEDHFDEELIFQWKDRKVVDKEAIPHHDYKSCATCASATMNEAEIHPPNGKRKRSKPKAPRKRPRRPKAAASCSTDVKSEEMVPCEIYIKEELEDIESFVTSLEITPLMDLPIENIPIGAEAHGDDIENITYMDASPIENQNEDITTEVTESKAEAESDTENKEDLLSKNFMEAESLECYKPNNLLVSASIDSMEHINGTCRICLANYFKGQSIFMIYKMKYLPHIVYNFTGTLPIKDDELPSMICFICCELLLQAESIRKRCIASEKFLRKTLQTKLADVNQNIELIKPNETSSESTLTTNSTSTFFNNANKTPVSVTKEHNYINLGTKKEKTKDNKVKTEECLIIKEESLDAVEECLTEKEDDLHEIEDLSKDSVDEREDSLKEESLHDVQYLDDTEILYDELFSESDVQYKEVVQLGSEKNDDFIKLPELYVCTACSRKILSLRAFKRHQKYHNAENFRCPVCPDEHTPETIKPHLYHHKARGELVCEDCGERFNEILDLYNHLISHAGAYNRNTYIHECEICGRKTPSLASHLNHMKKRHSVIVTKPFKCNQCMMRFNAKLGMQRHQDNIHNPDGINREKKFLCSTCGRRFFTRGNLQVHTRTHTGERPYKCQYCDKSFTQINSLTVHTYIHTGEKPFVCNICGSRFKQYSHFDYHKLTHSDHRPHVCKICNRGFRVTGTLNTHMKIHGNRPFRCEICDKGYPERGGLRKHLKKCHGSVVLPIDDYKQEEEILEVV